MHFTSYIIIAVICCSSALSWWRRKTLARAFSALPESDRALVAPAPYYTPPPTLRCTETLVTYRKLYSVTRWPNYFLWALYLSFTIAFIFWGTNS